jgi:hypothetical protein
MPVIDLGGNRFSLPKGGSYGKDDQVGEGVWRSFVQGKGREQNGFAGFL